MGKVITRFYWGMMIIGGLSIALVAGPFLLIVFGIGALVAWVLNYAQSSKVGSGAVSKDSGKDRSQK